MCSGNRVLFFLCTASFRQCLGHNRLRLSPRIMCMVSQHILANVFKVFVNNV